LIPIPIGIMKMINSQANNVKHFGRMASNPINLADVRAKDQAAADAIIKTANKIIKITPRPAQDILKDMKPKVFILEDILAKQNLYSLTAKNNHGKTTAAALIIKAITSGGNFGNHRTIQGRCLLLSGENTNDTMLKLIALGVDLSLLDVVDAPFDMKATIDDFLKHANALGHEYVGVFVDSTQAYFGDGEMNGNADQLSHWQALRRLTGLRGDPFVLSLSHPIKNATQDNLIPYGGGSAINEMDTNLTLWKDGEIATLGIGKTRQGQFEPIKMRLEVYEFEDRKNNFGKAETTSMFKIIGHDEAYKEEMKEATLQVAILKDLNLVSTTTHQQLGVKYFLKPGDSLLDPKHVEAAKKRAGRFIAGQVKDGYLTKLNKLTKKAKELL
jgi:hypothetical protein